MKNVKSSDGVINSTGQIGSPAFIVDPSSIDFYDEIEDGIKSTVKCAIDSGFETFSSCQGHACKESGYQQRTITLLLEKFELVFWRCMIADLNIINQFNPPIEYHILENEDGKIDFMIIIGSAYDLEETCKKQSALEKEILQIRIKYYSKEPKTFRDYTSTATHVNQKF